LLLPCAALQLPLLQERADDEHTTRGMRLVQAEVDAVSKGWPLGDGIGLFGVGSSRNGLPGAGGSSGKQRGQAQEQSVELNARAQQGEQLGAGGASSSSGRQPLFGGAAAGAAAAAAAAGGSGSGGRSGSPPSKAALVRDKYANRSSDSLASAASAPREQQRQGGQQEGAVDALFAGMESRPSRQMNTRLLDQPADSSSSSFPFSWKGRGR
jgi:hypothetical protein